jgi:hypothetical protein
MKFRSVAQTLKKEQKRLIRDLAKVTAVLDALAKDTGSALRKESKKKYKQSRKARKAIGAAKKKWWAARRESLGKKS